MPLGERGIHPIFSGAERNSRWPGPPEQNRGTRPPTERQVHREMMAKGGKIARDTLFGPERLAARALDWDQCDRGIHQGAQSVNCNSDAVYMAATDQMPNLTDPPLPRGRHPYRVQARWRRQVGIRVWGRAASRASAKPVSPSTTATRISWTSRLRRSFRTFAQNLTPSWAWNHGPGTSRVPSGRIASATKTALFETAPARGY